MIIPPNMQFPQSNANITPQGIQLTVTLAPGLAFTVNIGSDTVEQWMTEWERQKKAQAQEIRLIQHISERKR